MNLFSKKMVSISHLTVTSTQKLNAMLSSNVSSSLRVEVLISNLLAGLERGEYCEMDLCDLDDEEAIDLNHAFNYGSKKRQSRYIEEEEEPEEEEEGEEGSETQELEESLSPPLSPLKRGSPLRLAISPKKRPIEEEEEEEEEEENGRWRKRTPSPSIQRLRKAHVSLEEIEIQVMDDEVSSKPNEQPKRFPLMLRLKVPPSIPESSEEIQTIQISPPPSELSFFSINTEEVDPFEVLEPPEPLEAVTPLQEKQESILEKKIELLAKRKREPLEEEEGREEEQEEQDDSGRIFEKEMKRMVDLENGNSRMISPPSPLKKQRTEPEIDRKH